MKDWFAEEEPDHVNYPECDKDANGEWRLTKDVYQNGIFFSTLLKKDEPCPKRRVYKLFLKGKTWASDQKKG